MRAVIVNSLQKGWEVIYQRSHANLAAMLVAAWCQEDHVPRWTELIVATAQHDDQEMFWSNSPHLTDKGAPLDFTQNDINTTQTQAQRVIENAYRQGLWIALLISRHNSFLYEPMRGTDEQLDAFLDEQKRNQKEWCAKLGYSREQVERAYSFLRWADRMSLILCRRRLPDRDRELDVAPDRHGTMVRVRQRPDNTLSLTPWIFEDEHLNFSIEVRQLDQLAFADDQAFVDAMDSAEIKVREWCFRK
ncbi:MAG: DUF3891 family protein [Chloroflexi bacterium]|nr:DUF3891 family protein [Chloroflexota bacterium]